MDELRDSSPRIVEVLASSDACDRLRGLPGACRVSPDELMIVGEASIAALTRAVRLADPDAVVLDVSDGWVRITLDGSESREAFARLSELDLPETGFVQGELARVGVRVVAEGGRIDLLVPSMLGDHVRTRLISDGEEPLG